jgi:hypothetical protein
MRLTDPTAYTLHGETSDAVVGVYEGNSQGSRMSLGSGENHYSASYGSSSLSVYNTCH